MTGATRRTALLSRRSFVRGAGAAVVVVTASGCIAATPRPVSVAAGEEGGVYVPFATMLVHELRRAGIPADAVLRTSGSVQNIQAVRGGTAEMGLTLADVALAALGGTAPFEAPVPLRAVGRVYENYVQLVVRATDTIMSTADLGGRRLSLGAEGSGAAVFGDRLLTVADGIRDAAITRRPLSDAIAALEAGRIDALLWSGGIPTPALAELAQRREIRLLPLTPVPPELRKRYGTAYESVRVPAGVYGATAPVATIGVPNLLVCRPELPDVTAGAVARTLVGAAPALVPASALGTQYLDQRSLIGTGDVPLHPGAAAAYVALHG